MHILLELALTANRQNVVLHADVEILGIDFWKIGLHHQFVLGLVDVNRGRPGREAGFLARALEDIVKQSIDLILQGSGPAEGLPSSNCSHVLYTSLGDCMEIIKYERLIVKYKFLLFSAFSKLCYINMLGTARYWHGSSFLWSAVGPMGLLMSNPFVLLALAALLLDCRFHAFGRTQLPSAPRANRAAASRAPRSFASTAPGSLLRRFRGPALHGISQSAAR